MAHEATGRRQGTAERGFLICPHTCGCVITESIANKSRKKPKWLQRTPLILKAGSHSGYHIGNQEAHPYCDLACEGFTKKGRSLTDHEYTTWVPHLGNWRQFHQHIPPRFHNLFPANPLEDDYLGIPPVHPLPHLSVQTLQQGMGIMSIQPQASMSGPASASTSTRPHPHPRQHPSMTGPVSASTSTHPRPQASGSRSLGTASGASQADRKLLFIGTPRAESVTSLEEAKGLLVYDGFSFTDQTPKNIIRAIRTAPNGFVFPEPPSPSDPDPEMETFLIHDLMAWVITFLNAGWTLQWMTWPVFLDIILQGNFDRILNIKNVELMAGGFNLAVDYITAHPGLDNTNFDRFWNNLLKLSLQLPMFPHPQDLVASASKIQRDNDLMVVASTKTRTPFPKSIILNSAEDLLKACDNQRLVIKREYSDSNNCTYLPPKENEGSKLRKKKIMSKMKETVDLYYDIRSLPPPTWMGQPYIPSLLEKGELRTFVVGGNVMHAIHTLPIGDGRSDQVFVDSITPLSLLQDGKSKNLGAVLHRGGKTPQICNENLTKEEAEAGRVEFKEFVERTVKGVMDLENARRRDESSSLQVFCRVDVGVLKGPDNRFHYYVNELERSLTVGLYRTNSAVYNIMLNSAVEMIPQYVERSRRVRR